MINLEHLNYALILASFGNFTRAANALHISQPTLTRSIQRLEEQIGAPIFVRSKEHIKPTSVGRKFLKHAKKVLSEVRKLETHTAQEQGVLTGEIVIGTGTYPEELFLADILSRISVELPMVHVKVVSCSSIEFIDQLHSATLDFFIGEKSLIEKDRNIHCVSLTSQDEGFFFCRYGHPILESDSLTIKSIVQYPYVGIHIPGRMTNNLPKSTPFGDLIGSLLRPRICCYSFALQKKVVASSNCIGICLPTSIEVEIKQKKLVIVPADIPEIYSDYGVSYLKNRELSELDNCIIDIIVDVDKKRFKNIPGNLQNNTASRR